MAVRFLVAFTHKELASTIGNADLSQWVVLEQSAWDDHGYICTFRVVGHRDNGTPIPLGEWKILDLGATKPGATKLPREFTALPKRFSSLGQSMDAYERMSELPRTRRREILRGLRDLLIHPVPNIEQYHCFEAALIRFSEAKEVFRTGKSLARRLVAATMKAPNQITKRDSISLGVRAQLDGFDFAHAIRLRFSRAPEDLGLLRTVVLVGENGSGKTQLLAALAKAFSGLENDAAEVAPENPFALAIAVSYGAFDRFTRPSGGGRAKSYLYCGLREPGDQGRLVINVDSAIEETAQVLRQLLSDDERCPAWNAAMQTIGRRDLAKALQKRPEDAREMMRRLSAGWQIVVMSVTRLSAGLRDNAIVLFDEPETHLHPRLISALLRALRQLLETFDAYAVIATHSLIPIQETPRSNVIVLRVVPEAGIIAGPPSKQSFASTLDEIERETFGARHEDVNYQAMLERLAKSPIEPNLTRILGDDIGMGTRLTLAALRK